MPLKVTLNKYSSYELDGPKKEVFEDVHAVLDMDNHIDVGTRNFVDKSRILFINKSAFESVIVEKV